MKLRSIVRTVAAAAAVFLPSVVLAQTGTITTSPFAAAAPALGSMMLAVLVGCLLLAAMYYLRHTDVRAGAQTAVILAVTLVAGVGYSYSQKIVISGPECFEETTHEFSTNQNQRVTNDCPGPIQIDLIEEGGAAECSPPESTTSEDYVASVPCTEDLVLQPGDTCKIYASCDI